MAHYFYEGVIPRLVEICIEAQANGLSKASKITAAKLDRLG